MTAPSGGLQPLWGGEVPKDYHSKQQYIKYLRRGTDVTGKKAGVTNFFFLLISYIKISGEKNKQIPRVNLKECPSSQPQSKEEFYLNMADSKA